MLKKLCVGIVVGVAIIAGGTAWVTRDRAFDLCAPRVLDFHRSACSGSRGSTCTIQVSLLQDEFSSGHRELRLLALAFPGQSLKLGRDLVSKANRSDMEAGVRILRVLADEGDERAAEELLRVGLEGDRQTSWRIAELLVGASRIEGYRPLLFRQAAGGQYAAVTALVRFDDEDARGVLRGLLNDGTAVGTAADDILKFQAADWPSVVEGSLKGDSVWSDGLSLILLMAERRPVPGMSKLLRERLDRAARNDRVKYQEELDLFGRPFRQEDYARRFMNSRALGGDPLFADILLAHWKSGGELDALESGWLRTMGYGCDPRERLAEILREQAR